MGGARFSSSAQGAGAAAPGPHRPRGRARSKASAASCPKGSANASSTAQHADPRLVPSLKRQARFSSRAREGDSSASMPSNVPSVPTLVKLAFPPAPLTSFPLPTVTSGSLMRRAGRSLGPLGTPSSSASPWTPATTPRVGQPMRATAAMTRR